MSVKIRIKKNPEDEIAALKQENDELRAHRDDLTAKLENIQGVIAGDVEVIDDDEFEDER